MNNLELESKTVMAMIRIYCKGKHESQSLCESCAELSDYVKTRLEGCPFSKEKPTCKNCTVHCYQPEMRERIREVMRYAGPRMIFHHPISAVRHLIKGIKS